MNPFAAIVYIAGAIAFFIALSAFLSGCMELGIICLLVYGIGLSLYHARKGK